jgi:hypothetical protein
MRFSPCLEVPSVRRGEGLDLAERPDRRLCVRARLQSGRLVLRNHEGFSLCNDCWQGLKPYRFGGRVRHDSSRALTQSLPVKP